VGQVSNLPYREIWMIECYKYSAPLALVLKTLSPMTFYLHNPHLTLE
jgi:hypothetical protein